VLRMSDVTRCYLLPVLPSLGRHEFLPMFAETVTLRYCCRHRSQSNWKQIDRYVAVQCKAWSAPARLLGLWVRVPPGAWMSVSCVMCCQQRSLCLNTRAEES
jgi:hypothetical protein